MANDETPRERYLRQKREAAARWRANHPDEYQQTLARYRTANKENLRQRGAENKRLAYARNPQKHREEAKNRYWAKVDRNRERAKCYASDNAQANKIRAKAWREANPDRDKKLKQKALERRKECWAAFLEQERERYRKGYERDPGKYSAKGAARRCAKLRATPPWADLVAIAEIYRQAQQITRETGIDHDVDHIIPLRGKNVCGLHIPRNLQIIPSSANRRKFNLILEQGLSQRSP